MEGKRKKQLLKELVAELCAERGLQVPFGGGSSSDDALAATTLAGSQVPSDADAPNADAADLDVNELWHMFRALVNTRAAVPASAGFLARQDELLRGMIADAGVHSVADAEPSPFDARMRLWRGDITTLAVDAIVNAANSGMTGCWSPNHACIDNAIHTFAGVQLRAECAKLMEMQGHEEQTGCAKITRAWNLPAKYVIHTVGPIVSGGRAGGVGSGMLAGKSSVLTSRNGSPTKKKSKLLAQSYESCLSLAAEHGLSSIAFCCISTGVFGFPQKEAAEVAVGTVRRRLDGYDGEMTVVFNVFTETDERIYRKLLGLEA